MIYFNSEDIDIPMYITQRTSDWIVRVIQSFGKQVGELRFIFCKDEFLYNINVNFLNHYTYTDIITFDSSENSEFIAGDLFISLDRVHENAMKHGKPIENETHRVMIHGVLHLLGYKDKLASDILEMRAQEENCLSLLS